MIRNRLVSTVLLAFGTSAAAVLAADPPPLVLEPAPVTQPEPPPQHIIKIEIGFEPGPLEDPAPSPSTPEPPMAAPMPPPTPAPVVAPAPVVPPAPVVAPAELGPPAPAPATVPATPPVAPSPMTPKSAAITLGALERMALSRSAGRTQSPAGAIQPCSFMDKTGQEITDLPSGFVDQVVVSMASSPVKPTATMTPAQVQMLGQEYRVINGVRLRYYHLLALQKLIAVREDLANISRDAVTAIEAMTASGQATKAELLQARIEAREQMAALDNVRAVHQAVWVRMAAAIGQPNLPVAPLAGDVEQCCTVPAFDAAWPHVLMASPDLQAVRGEVARRQAALRQSLAGSNGKSGDGDKAAPDGVIGHAVALFSGPAATRDPQVKQAAWTDLSHWEAEVGRMEQSLKQRLAEAYARHDRAKEVAEVYRAQNLPDAKEVFELSVIGYRQGHGSWPQVQLAQRNYFRMSTEYVEALAELRRTELVILGMAFEAPEETPAQK